MVKLETFLIEAEGFEKEVYLDSKGNPTIGVGHYLTEEEKFKGTITIGSEEVDYSDGLGTLQVMALLAQDLDIYELAVHEGLTVDITEQQYIALVSFCFNVGVAAFQDSTLLRRINANKMDRVPYELMKWIHAGNIELQDGTILPREDKGLRRRRVKELVMWLTGE